MRRPHLQEVAAAARAQRARGQAQHDRVQERAVAEQGEGEAVGQPHLVVLLALVVLLERGQARSTSEIRPRPSMASRLRSGSGSCTSSWKRSACAGIGDAAERRPGCWGRPPCAGWPRRAGAGPARPPCTRRTPRACRTRLRTLRGIVGEERDQRASVLRPCRSCRCAVAAAAAHRRLRILEGGRERGQRARAVEDAERVGPPPAGCPCPRRASLAARAWITERIDAAVGRDRRAVELVGEELEEAPHGVAAVAVRRRSRPATRWPPRGSAARRRPAR